MRISKEALDEFKIIWKVTYGLVKNLPNIEQLILRAGLRRILEQSEHIKAFGKDKNAALSEAEKYFQTLKSLKVC